MFIKNFKNLLIIENLFKMPNYFMYYRKMMMQTQLEAMGTQQHTDAMTHFPGYF